MFDLARAIIHHRTVGVDRYRLGAAFLEEGLNRWPTAPNAPEAMAMLAPVYGLLGRSAEGRKMVEILRSKYPEETELSERAESALNRAAGIR